MTIFRSFQNFLAFNMTLVVILPLAVFGFATHQYLYVQKLEEVQSEQAFQLSELQNAMSDFISEAVHDLRTVVYNLGGHADLRNVGMLQVTPTDRQPIFNSIFLLDKNLRVRQIVSHDEYEGFSGNYINFDCSGMEIFSGRRNSEDVIFSEVHVSPFDGHATVSLAIPSGAGYVLGNLSLEYIYNVINRWGRVTHSEFSLLDRNGVLIAHTDPDLIGQRISYRNHPEVIRGLQGESGVWEHTHPDRNALEGIQIVPKTKWLVWSSTDLDAAMQAENVVRSSILIFLLISFGIALVLAGYTWTRLARPIRQFTGRIKDIADRGYGSKEPLRSFSEFERLSAAMDQMARAIEFREQHLLKTAEGTKFLPEINSVCQLAASLKEATQADSVRIVVRDEQSGQLCQYNEREAVAVILENDLFDQLAGIAEEGEAVFLASALGDDARIGESFLPECSGTCMMMFSSVSGKIRGVVGVGFQKEIDQKFMVENSVRIFGFRVLVELERDLNIGALEASEKRLRNVIQSLPMGMLLVEKQSNGNLFLSDANAAAEIVFEEDVRAAFGADIQTLLPGLMQGDFPALLEGVLQGNELWEPKRIRFPAGQADKVLEILLFSVGENQVACMALDASERYMREQEALSRQRTDHFVAGLSRELNDIVYGSGALEEYCNKVMMGLGQLLEIDGCFLLKPKLAAAEEQLECRACWYRVDYRNAVLPGDIYPYAQMNWLRTELDENSLLVVEDIEQLPPGAEVEKKRWQGQGLKSVLFIRLPMLSSSHALVGIESIETVRKWNEKDIDLFSRTSELLLRALEREAFTLDLQKSENEYRQLNEEFQTILTGISDHLILWTRDREMVWSNLVEPTPGESRSNFFCHCALLDDKGDQCDDCPIEKCFATGEFQSHLLKTDEKQWGIKVFPVHDGNHQVHRVITMTSDVTERNLMRAAAERTSRLTSLGQIAAGVAHEINNPNALVLMNASVLKDVFTSIMPMLEREYEQFGDFSVGKMKYSRMRQNLPKMVSDIETAAGKIRSIVNDLRGYVTRGELITEEGVDLNLVITEAVSMLGSSNKEAKNRIKMELAEDLPGIKGSARRLEQVVINLVSNALYALEEREGQIFIKTSFDRQSDSIDMVVKDQGEGIAEDHLGQIADPFFTTRRNVGGTGLGLSVCTDIIREHGGEILFDSKLNKGTTVTVRLPIRRTQKLDSANQKPII